MNSTNLIIVISTLIISLIFFGGVFINLDVKRSKDELEILKNDIEKIKIEVKRQRIEIAVLSNPYFVIDYIEKNNLKPVDVDNISILTIRNEYK